MSDERTQGVAAVGFLVMAFTDETAADDTLKVLKSAKRQNKFYFEEAAVIRQDAKGKVHYHETGDIRTGTGAGVGALVGGVLGILGGPAGIAFGAGVGAAAGAVAAHKDSGFRDESLESVGVALQPSTSALAMITSSDFLKAVQEQASETDISGMVDNLSAEISSKLAEGKSMALGLLLAEDGLAVQEVAVTEDTAEIAGYVITNEAVVAGAAQVTADGVDYAVGVATEEGAVVEAGVITEDEAAGADVAEEEEAPVEEAAPDDAATANEGEPEGEEESKEEADSG